MGIEDVQYLIKIVGQLHEKFDSYAQKKNDEEKIEVKQFTKLETRVGFLEDASKTSKKDIKSFIIPVIVALVTGGIIALAGKYF